MLSWTLTFLIIAIIAAVIGLSGTSGKAGWIIKTLSLVFFILYVVSTLLA